MVDTIFPVDAVAGSPSYGGRMLRQVNAVAFGGATAARPLGGRSGVRPGTSTTTVTATSTTWTCGPLAGVADVETAAEAGMVSFAFDANATGAVTAANATYARRDLIYVQVDIPVEDGSSVPVVTRKYVAGVASGTPVDPALPVSRAFAIARINVPASGGGSPTVTWIAPYAVAAGGILPVPSSASYPAAPYTGQVVDDAALGYALRWNGSAWKSARGVTELGFADRGAAPSDVIVSAVSTWQDVPSVTLTATSTGGVVEVDWEAVAKNQSGGTNYYEILYRVVVDGVSTGGERNFALPGVTGINPPYEARGRFQHTPTAGAHTWKLQHYCGAATVTGTKWASLKLTER